VVHTIQEVGPPAERLNMVLLGDGYQWDQQSLFLEDVDRNLAVMWSVEPFRSYRHHINIYAVEIASIDYGVRRDPDGRVRHPDGTIRDTGETEGPIDAKNTALRLWYSDGLTNPLARGTTYGPAPVDCQDYAEYYPEGVDPCENGNEARDRIMNDSVAPVLGIPGDAQNVQTLAIFNSFTYGGIGGVNATTSGGSPQGPLVSLHELGHSLGTSYPDEYPYSSRDVVRPCRTAGEPASEVLRFDLRPLWRARWTVLLYGLVAVASVQVAFYASLERIPVSMTLLIEYLAPIALVLFAWVRTRRMPQVIVLGGSVLAIVGLVLVIGPGGGDLDALGLVFAAIAMIGVCVYYAIGERATEQLPPVALIAAGFVVGAIALGLAGLVGVLPMRVALIDVAFLGGTAPWWAPLVTVGAVSTAFAYTAGVAAIRLLGARLSSFLGLSEVVFAGIVGWILLGEALGALQILGGVLILGGIVFVRLERAPAATASVALDIDLVPVPEERPRRAHLVKRA
jgi:drug/metabolite transporter (DMT)-like permease